MLVYNEHTSSTARMFSVEFCSKDVWKENLNFLVCMLHHIVCSVTLHFGCLIFLFALASGLICNQFSLIIGLQSFKPHSPLLLTSKLTWRKSKRKMNCISYSWVILYVYCSGNPASATIQPYFLLHLDIFPDVVNTIEDALHLFSVPETLEGFRTSHTGKVWNSFLLSMY